MLMSQAVHYREVSAPSSSSCLYPVRRRPRVATMPSQPALKVSERKPLGMPLTLLESTLTKSSQVLILKDLQVC
jgi:hypothetical protein